MSVLEKITLLIAVPVIRMTQSMLRNARKKLCRRQRFLWLMFYWTNCRVGMELDELLNARHLTWKKKVLHSKAYLTPSPLCSWSDKRYRHSKKSLPLVLFLYCHSFSITLNTTRKKLFTDTC